MVKVKSIAEIAVNVPLERLFHYEVPRRLADRVEVGHRVLIPFGRRTATGVCVAFPDQSDVPKLKPISDLLHPECRFDAHLLEFTRWIAEYSHVSWGEVLEAALPPSIRSGRGERGVRLISTERTAQVLRAEAERWDKKGAPARARLFKMLAQDPGPYRRADLLKNAQAGGAALRWLVEADWVEEEERPYAPPPVDLDALSSRTEGPLHASQETALERILEACRAREFQPILLHGVTGSGKTEVYLRALHALLAEGRRGLVLVPEISLTPQTVLRFRQGLGDKEVAVLHSMLPDSERTRQWREIQSGRAKVVIGARSAVFSPVPDLGLIIIDEEHEPSYKQESSPRYNARDAAVVRARMLGIPIVLGSATPSLETYHNAHSGKYRLIELPERVTSHDLPVMTAVTLDAEFYRPNGTGLISEALDRLIRARLKKREQVLLFLNRRGFATYVHCIRCGFVAKCKDCDITLTFHRRDNVLRCHCCGYGTSVPPDCPECKMPGLRRTGVGTEKITSELNRRYEDANVARLDRDTVRTHRSLQETLGRFAAGEIDILVGTQMVAKGHDFPGVTLVGVINADTGLHFPDFRAAERTYQLITQVAGRAGRGQRAGRVVVQTYQPDHYAISAAVNGREDEFYRSESECRRELGYPPFGYLAKIIFQGRELDKVRKQAKAAAAILEESATVCRVLGPVPAPIARIQGRHRLQILLKSESRAAIHRALASLKKRSKPRRGAVDRIIDIDPYTML